MIHLRAVELPAFGREERLPEIPVSLYRRRLENTVSRMQAAGLDCLAVYGDREHCANIAYLTGFDPRFEEALLLLDTAGRKLLLVGNECMGYLPAPEIGLEVELFQGFSLMGQPRGSSRPLREILADFGVRAGTRVGCAGWKYFETDLVEGGHLASELPSYLVDLLRDLAGAREYVVNANVLFMNPADGLRTLNEPEQIAQFEYAATVTSDALRQLILHLEVGVEERALEPLLDGAGLPLSCHRMISFGEKAKRGLASPSHNRAKLGDPYTACIGVFGSLTSRAGCIARGPQDLPAVERDFYARYVANYFDVVCTWYESLRLGATGGEVWQAVEARRDDSLYHFAVNPGHTLHLDEWVHSPFAAGSPYRLRSGMALQMDIIPVSNGPFYYANGEDGIALADAGLRAELAERFPGCWERIQRRREFMAGTLGIRLDECVLPLSNLAAWLPPYALAPEQALVKG